MVLRDQNFQFGISGQTRKQKNWIRVKQIVALKIRCRSAWQTADVSNKIFCLHLRTWRQISRLQQYASSSNL